jgi:hypothetical protein
MVAGEKISSALMDIRKAQTVLNLSKVWAPSSGYSDAYIEWRRELQSVARPLGLAPHLTEDGAVAPSAAYAAFVSSAGPKTRGAHITQTELEAADKEWWELNTILYNLVDKSIDWVTGNVDPEDDKAKVLMLMATDGSWGDGVGYLKLLEPYHDVTSVDKQTSLRNEIAALKFNADMGYEDFYEFATKLSENWALIEGNDLLNPKYFYQELMRLMPTTPVTSQMVQIRSKLVTMVTEKHEILGTVKKCLRVLMEFGEVLGMKARMAHGAGGAVDGCTLRGPGRK